MQTKFSKKLFTIVLFFYFPLQTMAWGLIGHRVVAEVADSYLKPNIRAEIKKILGNESLAMISNWADFVKADPAYSYLSTWHYVNIDRGLSFTEMDAMLKQDTSTNAYSKINVLVRELKNEGVRSDKKKFYLRMLVHLVGDIHQPLHVGNKEDRGGGNIKVLWGDKASDLHSVWDNELIDCQKLSYTEYTKAINTTTEADRKQWIDGGVAAWLFESYKIADTVYASAKSGDTLGYRYNYDHIATVNQQLLKGGVRLAALLNEIFTVK